MTETPRARPLDLHQWIADNAAAFEPPVSNKVVWQDSDQIFMVIRGPNARSDFHVDPYDEVFMQLKGDIRVDLMIDGERHEHWIREGQVMLVPANVPHSPLRPANTWGVVIERPRPEGELDSLVWYCEVCGEEVSRVTFHLSNIETELAAAMRNYNENEALRTCPTDTSIRYPRPLRAPLPRRRPSVSDIGTLNEGSLHSTLKAHYAAPGDEFEVALDRFVIDIKRGERELIEIQTVSFKSMGKKLDHLLPDYEVLLVHPIAVATYLDRPGRSLRKSPKRGSIFDLFDELVSVPTLLDHPNLTIEVPLVTAIKTQIEDPKARRGRGGYRTVNRSLQELHETQRFERAEDLLDLVPVSDLPKRFTTADLAEVAAIPRSVAQRIAYCFRPLGFFHQHERTKAGYIYTLSI